MTEVERAYLAGILDGEGCISFGCRLKKYLTVTVQVSNTNFALIQWFIDRYERGTWYNCGEKRPTRKPCYMWRCAGAQAKEVLRDALPYLVLKRPQAELALSLPIFKAHAMKPLDFENNRRVLSTMRELNRRGIA